MKFNSKIAAFLSVLLLICTLAAYSTFAADELGYHKLNFESAEEKVASMELMLEENGSRLYVDRVSGEIAFEDIATGEILLSNPYDVASSTASENIKNQLLSQLIIKFEENGSEKTLDSYFSAATNKQITVKRTKTGVRVEYIIGEQVTRRLIPRLIERSRFEELILANFPNGQVAINMFAEGKDSKDIAPELAKMGAEYTALAKFIAFYQLRDPFDPTLTETKLRVMNRDWPITEDMAVYVFDSKAASKEEKEIENQIKEYAPQYTFEMLDEDHEMTRYESSEKSPPLFRMALEYSIDENGNLDVRLPANGIRFDETVYSLTSVQILPFFGAGKSDDDGEIFIPDGSGAIIKPASFDGKPITLTNMLYGQDYAYQTVAGAHQEVMHMPVYGVVQNIIEKIAVEVEVPEEEKEDEEPKIAADGVTIMKEEPKKTEYIEQTKKLGYVAIINEGDSLASVTARNGGPEHGYFSAFTAFSPRPKDTYNLSEEASGGQHTIVSERKYTGSYRLKFIMLIDDAVAEEKEVEAYTPSYVGMAHAYRDYLVNEGIIEKLTDEDVKKDIPLYIESFGAIETTERFLTIPVTVLKELTTFDNLKTMTEDLEEDGITNVNYKLTGFANGGMVSTAPTKVKFDKAVGGNKGFKNFVSYADEKGILVFPDFDFTYLHRSETFDGFSNKSLVKTMDGRYISKRYYDSTTQAFEKTLSLAISPSAYDDMYSDFTKSYSKLGNNSLAVSTLGSDLNSDFDKKEPYNREDSKQFTKDVLERMSTDYENVLSDAANAYTLGYVDHYLNVPLDSSNYLDASASVPFMGIVLHGYKDFAGTAINMAGDLDYHLLKSIESGSSIFFTLSYDNTRLLKESEELNKYYSVDFSFWKDDVVKFYNELNEAISDCQTSEIVSHEFTRGYRFIDENSEEAIADNAEREALEEEIAEANEKAYQKELKKLKREARKSGADPEAVVLDRDEFLATLAEKNDAQRETLESNISAKYITDEGKIVIVTYENGVQFVLNYNSYDVVVDVDGETLQIDALDYVKTNVKGDVTGE